MGYQVRGRRRRRRIGARTRARRAGIERRRRRSGSGSPAGCTRSRRRTACRSHTARRLGARSRCPRHPQGLPRCRRPRQGGRERGGRSAWAEGTAGGGSMSPSSVVMMPMSPRVGGAGGDRDRWRQRTRWRRRDVGHPGSRPVHQPGHDRDDHAQHERDADRSGDQRQRIPCDAPRPVAPIVPAYPSHARTLPDHGAVESSPHARVPVCPLVGSTKLKRVDRYRAHRSS